MNIKTWSELNVAIDETGRNVSELSRKLGLGRSTIYRKFKTNVPLRLTLEEHAWLEGWLYPKPRDKTMAHVPAVDASVTDHTDANGMG